MQSSASDNFWQFDSAYLFKKLNSSDKGLSQADADKILHQSSGLYPKNKSRLRKDALLFISQFKSPLMLLLIGAVLLSAFLGDTSDVFIILFIVTSTGLLSFFQERNAGRVVEKLQSMISLKSTVLRDGLPKEIISKQIVPGDIIILNAGDLLPADCLIIEATELHANESSLTGESFPIRKETGILNESTELSQRTNCLWEGTSIVSGNAKALVIQTGNNTIFGTIALSASNVIETSFEKGIKDFGFFLIKITLVLAAFILMVNLLNHKNIIESALFALALAVGMAPELLPAISTIAMSAGARRMLDKKVIVKKLSSIQNLGEVNLLCTDKTGTITEGNIKISGLIDGFGTESEFIKQLAYWNANFETGYSNPIDDSIRQLTLDSKFTAEKIGEIPYDFIRKRLSIAIHTDTKNLLISKGAFIQILSICTKIRLTDGNEESISAHKQELEKKFEKFGTDGLRAIGICYKNIDSNSISKEMEADMIFAGFILLNDPIKSDISQTISELHNLNVNLKIITGDNRNIAKSIAQNIGIKNPVIMTGKELFIISPEALKQLVKKTHIFAEVEPQQKERIILALRKNYTVAYMGDGINDVSAITAADVGISVENAVDVAREAADFVLMEKNLTVLVDGIKEGRKTFANTLKYLYINTGSTFGNMFSVAAASLILPFLPMLPKQILLTNFLTDFPFLTVTSDNVDSEQLERPGKWNLILIRNYMLIFGIHSALFDLITFLTLLFVLKVKESEFQTGWFIESVLSELFILFIIRTHKSFFKSKPGNYLFIFSIIALLITIGLPYLPFSKDIGLTPLPFINLIFMLVIVFFYIVTAELLKIWFFKKFPNS
ncbi:magnesium-translocating P-type ATPase [Flavobacterium sp. 123]|uniref:magnesium-translocating P-type ATPase n=1 Tax=Flavobacterium sp. 123 TaxID=2135627 RepID=UPI000EAC6E87|nr:magnesium-translocating P-type ATPase [Flavobacterium sp. 123]RKT00557.1 Mg2+-importing ATPase [Flavobacterium sp. 123]